MNTKIFISHKKEDSDKAESVAKYIKEHYKFEIYVDTQEKFLNQGEDVVFLDEILKGLK